jgi:CRP/FNR family transcriptional regulator, cyclic AMP receptor protein
MTVADLAQQDYREVARHAGQVLLLAPGEALFREGEPASEVFVLLRGALEISARGRVIEVLAPGDALGVVSVLDRQPRTATATATEASEVAVLDARKFRFLVETTPGFVWFVMRELAQRLRATNAAL